MAEADWELSKENVQPLKQGRDVGTLKDVLAQHEGQSQISIKDQFWAFETEIRSNAGNDPLDVWDRYLKWTEQVYPHGGTDSNLSALLERSVRTFLKNDQYYSDLRYLCHWLKFIDYCTDPLEVFDFLKSKGIGVTHAVLYISWAEQYELLGNNRKAEAALQEGIRLQAEPREKLQHHLRSFQSRICRQVVAAINEGGSNEVLDPEPVQSQRRTLGELKRSGRKKVLAPVNRIGSSMISQRQGFGQHVVSSQDQNGTFEVFNENQLSNQPSDHPRLTDGQWSTLPATSAKENEIKPGQWNSLGMPRRSNAPSVPFSALLSASKPDFKLFEEESAHVEPMTPCKIEPLFTPVLSARKPSREANPLSRVQIENCKEEKVVSMYSKDQVYGGLREFSFEELRAEDIKKKYKSVDKEQEQKLLKLKKEKEEIEQLIHINMKRIKEHQERLQLEAQQNKSDVQTQVPMNVSVLAAQPQSDTDTNVFTEDSCTASLDLQNQVAGNVTNSVDFGTLPNISEMKTEDSCKDGLNRAEMRKKNLNLSNCTDGGHMESGEPNALEVQNLSANYSLLHVQPSPTVCTKEALDVINGMFCTPVNYSQWNDINESGNLGAVSGVCSDDQAFEVQFMKNADKHDPSLVPKQIPSFFGLPTLPFNIFNEISDVEDQENKPPADYLKSKPRWPLSGILVPSKDIPTEETCVAEVDDLDVMEPLTDHFESNDYPNKTLGPFPENACDFSRGAHLVSTPFHQDPLNGDASIKWISDSSRTNLNSLSLFKESMYDQPLHKKKLSPIQEASEDGLSSATTTSSGSTTSVGALCAMSDLNIFEKSEPGQLNSSEVFYVNSISDYPWDIEVRNQLLLSLPTPLSSFQDFYVQNGSLPVLEDDSELILGSQTFNIKQAAEHEQCRIFYGMDASLTFSKAIIKVNPYRLPWDFYINQQLKMRLGSQFNKYFGHNQCCYLFDNCCVTVDQDKGSRTIKDISQIWESVPEPLVMLLTLDLLALVEQMHSAEIVHGCIAPETLFLYTCHNNTSIWPNDNSLVKLMDFTHSVDLRLQSDVATFAGFPTVHSLPNRELALECTSAYQVDLLGIADTMHFLLFGEHLDVYKEDSLWILSPTSYRMELLYMEVWSCFFEKILNAGNASSMSILKELQQIMREAIEE